MSIFEVMLLRLKLITFDKFSMGYLILGIIGALSGSLWGMFMLQYVILGKERVEVKNRVFKFIGVIPVNKRKIILSDYIIYYILIIVCFGIGSLIEGSIKYFPYKIFMGTIIVFIGIVLKYLNYRSFCISQFIILILTLGFKTNQLSNFFIGIISVKLVMILTIVLIIAGYIISTSLYSKRAYLKNWEVK